MILSNESFWHVLFHAGVNEKTRSRPLAVRILKRCVLNYEDNLCRMTIHEKTILFQNLQRLFIKLYVNVN